MIIRMLPDQVTKMWEELRVMFANAVPNEANSPYGAKMLLEAFIREYAHVWLIIHKEKCAGYLVTVLNSGATGVSSLHIFYIVLFEHVTDEVWEDGLATLRKFARNLRCKSITAMTENQNIVERCTKFGATIRVAIELEV